ncbi:MAG: insulinase family protein, partial [Treponema sp.]|nr:insulinase family protein [Treponema sp.]
MKKFIVFLSVFFLSISLYSFTESDIKLFTLENNLHVYFLEDSSSPALRMELCLNAGFACQDQKTGGLFNMYARLSGGDLSSDCVRYTVKVAPSAAEKALISLSDKLKPLSLSDFQLSSMIKSMNAEYKEYDQSVTAFINRSIDSKVFYKNPWSRESGVNPASFAVKKIQEVRTELNSIGEKYYSPSNACLFINGNITEEAVLALVEKYFSSFPSSPKIQRQSADIKEGKGRKFVLAHKDFTDEMTQIVLQYTSLDRDEGDALSYCWNMEGSSFKKLLLKQRNLKILGDEYIDVSSAQEKSSSRLIIQSLLGKAKVSPVVQAELFYSMSRDPDVFSKKELQKALKQAGTDFIRLSESSDATMEAFSRQLSLSEFSSSAASDFFQKNDRLSQINISDLEKKITAQEPYSFVLLNSNLYQKYAGDFKKAGFTEISPKEAAWYNQKEYKNLNGKKEKQPEVNSNLLEEIASSASRFISNNLAEFSSLTLENGIPVSLKRS